jgi:hypothetical protein
MSTDAESQRPSVPVPGMGRLTQAQFHGVIALLVGVCQMIVGIGVLDGLLTVVVSWGGALLSGFGLNLLRNRPVFYTGWSEDGEPGWVNVLINTLLTVVYVVAAGFVLVG